MPLLGANGGLIGAARTSRRGAAVGLWTPNEQVIYQRQNAWIGDSSFDSVSLLLHMDGSNGSTTFTDSSKNGLTLTANGNAQISTAQSKFGGASGAFDGTGDYVFANSSSLFGVGTGDFTIEAWIYATNATGTRFIASMRLVSGVAGADFGNNLAIETGKLGFSNGTAWNLGATTISTNSWYHVAVTRQSSTMNLWLNGSADRSSWVETSDFGTSRPSSVGAATDGSVGFSGYIDELRITKGVARYTANFTPPTAPFSDA